MNPNTDPTIRLPEPFETNPLIAVGIALIMAGLAAAFFWPDAQPATSAPAPTPALAYVVVTATASAPTPTTSPAQPAGLPRALVAYAAPAGLPLGAIEAGREYRPLARSGADWILLDVAGSGAVWVQAGELLGAAGSLVDLATPVPPPAPVVVYQATGPAPVYMLQATATPEMVHWSQLPQFITPPDYPCCQPTMAPMPPLPPSPTPRGDGWGSLGGGAGGSWGTTP